MKSKFILPVLTFLQVALYLPTQAQMSCDTTNFPTAYVINEPDYPYTSAGGITITSSYINALVYPAAWASNCGGQSYGTRANSIWLNATNQSWTLTFSQPVSRLVMVISATDGGEEFYFNANTGTITLSGYCTGNFTSTGNALTCFGVTPSPAAGTYVIINNSMPATQYTVTHNGALNGSILNLLDCFSMGCPDVKISQSICQSDLPFTWNGKTVRTTGTHTLTDVRASSITGCDSTTTLTLTVHSNPQQDLQETICEQDLPFQWNGQSVTATGTHILTDVRPSEVSGCDSTTTLTLTVNPNPRIYITDTICESPAGFVWNNQSIQAPGRYTLKDTRPSVLTGCDSITTLDLTIHPSPEIAMTPETPAPYCIGDTIALSFSGAVSYDWRAIRPLPDFSKGRYYLYEGLNLLTVKGTNELNCTGTKTFTILADECCDMAIPNAFSPNNDGMNDFFYVIQNGNPAGFVLLIFDRWGKEVFQSFNVNVQWDGSHLGRPVEAGVYYYYIEATCAGGNKTVKRGEIHLIR